MRLGKIIQPSRLPLLLTFVGIASFIILLSGTSIENGQFVGNPCAISNKIDGNDELVRLLLKAMQSNGGHLINVNITNVIKTQNDGENNLQSTVKAGFPRNKPNNDPVQPFDRVLDNNDKHIIYMTLIKLATLCDAHNLTYMMYSGTLMGSFRHHDMIPWDDDLDIFMNYSEKAKVEKVLSNSRGPYKIVYAGSRRKFYSMKGKSTTTYEWKWPYIDISFFKENETHIWDGSMEDDYGDRHYVYRKDHTFPLHKRPLGPYYFNAPLDSYYHIHQTYNQATLGGCYTSHYSHKGEKLTGKVHEIKCEELKDKYPFVHRTPDENGVRETLVLGTQTIHSFVVDEPKYAITEPYNFKLV